MQSLGGFFEKFNNKFVREVKNLVFITESIQKHTGIVVDAKNFTVSQGILRIKASAVQKNEIFIKKTRILKDLEGKLYALKIRDIQ